MINSITTTFFPLNTLYHCIRQMLGPRGFRIGNKVLKQEKEILTGGPLSEAILTLVLACCKYLADGRLRPINTADLGLAAAETLIFWLYASLEIVELNVVAKNEVLFFTEMVRK